MSDNPQTTLGEARKLTAAEILANAVRSIEYLHDVAMKAAQSFDMAKALQTYELAYNVARQHQYIGSKHIITCALLVWYRGLDGNIDGARQALDEAKSIAVTDIDKNTLDVVLRMMARNRSDIRDHLITPGF